MPRVDADASMANEITTRGDVSVTLTSADYNIQFFNTTLTANRTITLPSTGVFAGMTYKITRKAGTAGAFTLTVSDPLSGQNYTIPSNTNGYVEYYAPNTVQWVILNAGIIA